MDIYGLDKTSEKYEYLNSFNYNIAEDEMGMFCSDNGVCKIA